ncbi:MAG: shikimate dehydrogenase [Opitutales bacterium]
MNLTKLIGGPPDSKEVHFPEDLKGWTRKGFSLAVLGNPIGHSISPVIHNAALSEMTSLDPEFADWRYFRFKVPLQRLQECLPEFANRGFRGLNLTIPHKVDALGMIDWVDPEAALIGAVNTLVFNANGRCEGFNTDGYGLERAVEEEFGFTLDGASVILLGAGGAARAAATRILRSGCSELWIGNRSKERLTLLIQTLVVGPGQRVETFALSDAPPDLPHGSGVLLINATSLGLNPEDGAPLDLSNFATGTIVYDMIYNPVETALLRAARKHGMRTANGMSMLVHQAARSLEIWTDAEVPTEPMFVAAKKALGMQGESV